MGCRKKDLFLLVVLVSLIPVHVTAVPLTDLFPFGLKFGDDSLPPGDDASATVTLQHQFPFYGENREYITVHTDGRLDLRVDQYSHSSTAKIFTYSANVDTTNIGEVFYRETKDPFLLKKAAALMLSLLPEQSDATPTSLFIATWFYVGYYDGHSDKTNTFQCVLATNGTVSFATFLYVDGHMQWTASDSDSGGALEVGFLDGSNSASYLFPPDDLTDIDTGSNAGYPGKWLFRIDGEHLITPDAGAVKTAMEIEERDRRDISGEGPTIDLEEGEIGIGFEVANLTVFENQGFVEVCVFIDPNQLSDVATIEFQLVTGDGTATAPDDYTALSETIMVAVSTQHRECRNITIQEDKVFENDETFHIILCLPPGSVDSTLRFTITRLYITIIDTTVFVEGCDFISFIELNDPTTVSLFELIQDGTSSPVEIDVRFPFGIEPGMVQEQAFFRIAENGAITFDGDCWRFFEPELFPSLVFVTRNRYVLAPFWADHDIQSGGNVQYQVFQCGVSSLVDQQLEFVSIFIRKQFTDAGNFLGVWMLVVNWNEIPQFAGDSVTTNTYQAIAITDGMNSYAIYTYNCDQLGWGGGATIGFNAFGVQFGNDPASGRPTVHTDIACQNVFGDRGVPYANVLFHVGRTVNPAQIDRVRCLELWKSDTQLFPLLFPVHSCPCFFGQALRDWRFFSFAIEIQIEPFFDLIFCFRRIFPLVQGGNLKCCYPFFTFQFLQITGPWASAVERFDPRIFPDQNAIYDDEFRRVCCQGAGLCNVFHLHRPRDFCFFYFPPFRGRGGGDPHVTTLDGRDYTFNGLGEYTLITTDEQSIVIQGRTELTPGTGNTGATQFSAFAFGQPGSSVVEIQRPMDAGVNFIVQYNRVDISINVTNINDSFIDVNISVSRTAENTVLSVFPNGVSISVSVNGDLPNIVVSLPQNLQGQTRGLLGNFNGNDTDDFFFFNGTMLSSDASEREIFDFGQSWQITEAESLFNYLPGESTDSFSVPDHVPSFTDEVVGAADPAVIEACGGSNNTRCIFDSVQTNSTSVGLATLDFDESTQMDQMITINNPPTLQGESIFTVNTGEEAVYSFNATDDDEFTVSTMDGVPANGNLIQMGSDLNFTFTIPSARQNLADFSLGFSAQDSEGAVSSLQPQLRICACVNGNCTIEGIADTGANTIVLNCECPEAYSGRFCEDDVDGCAGMPCFEGVECMDVEAPGVGAMCGMCPEGYSEEQEKCIDINECVETPSVCEQNCTNTVGSFVCGCNTGFELQSDGSSCNDTDECSQPIPPCDQTCNNTIGSFLCGCMEGFELEPDSRTCNGTPCGANNPCSDRCFEVNGTAMCFCFSGRMLQDDGVTCTDINECMLSPSVCEQICTDTAGSFVCGCNIGFELQSDESSCIDIDECIALNMACPIEQQVCMNTIGSFNCECPPGTALVDGACQVANIMFLETAITVEESAGFMTVCINISGGIPDTAIVRLSTVASTATAGSDYTPVENQAIVFESSPNQVCENICVMNDMLVEEIEQFALTLTTVAMGTNLVISESRATVFVIDSSVVDIGFVVPTYTVDECESCPVTLVIGMSGSSLARNVTFTLSTQDDTALGNNDYVSVSPVSLEFGPMSSSEIEIEVLILSDNITEDAEQFIAQLESSDTAVRLSTSSANITIVDTSVVSVEFDPRSYAVNESSYSVSVCIRVNGQRARNIVVHVKTSDISATAPYDYTPIYQYLVFTPQMDRRYIDVEIADDIFREPTEFFGVVLSSNDAGVTVLTTLAVVEIMDTSVPYLVVFQQPSYTVSESMSSITVGVNVTGIPPATEVTIRLSTMEESAEADEDYATTVAEVILNDDGEAMIYIPIINDEVLEDMLERFEVRVTATANVTGVPADIPQESVSVFIVDADDGVSASLVMTSFVISETEASRNLAVYVCVDLMGNRQEEVTLELTAESGSAQEEEDFPETSNTLVFPPGSGSQQECAAFPVIDDDITEGDESFTISLSSLLPCINITVDEASVEIVDDDIVSIGFAQASFTVLENYTTVTVLLNVTGEASRNLTISVSTEDGTATAGEDYVAISPPLMIELTPDSLEDLIEVEVTILNNEVLEQMIETFTVFLETSDPAVSITTNNATVLIVEDDGPLVMFTQSVYNGTEGNNALVCLTLNGEAVFNITVTLASMNGNAEAGTDYTMINEDLTFVAGEMMVCQDIELLLDNDLENTESFTVNLSANDPPDVMIPFPTATVEILDANIADISFEFETYSVNEDGVDVRVCAFESSNTMLTRSVVVTLTTQDDTAQAPMDYTAVSLELLFSGPTFHCADLMIANDGAPELTEVFRVVLSSDDPAFAPSVGTALVTITDDDDNPCNSSPCDVNAECRVTSSGTIECACNQGYTGDGFSCSLILPEISFVNNTPTVSNVTLTLTVQFSENEGVQSSVCRLGPRSEQDCTGGTFTDPNFPPNKVTPFTLRITSTAFDGSTTTQLTRDVNIGGRQTCSITIWNDGQVGATYTSQNAFIVEWEGAGPVESFNCILRQDDNTVSSTSCSSPFESGALVNPGNYFVEIQPMGSTCRVQRPTTVGPVAIPKPDCNACDVNAECRLISPGAVQCTCNQGYTGDGFSCSLILPEISFVNNTPTVSNVTLTLTVQFSENEGVQSSVCQLGPRLEQDCTGGTFEDPNFPQNKVTPFTLRITSTAFDGSTTTQLTRAVNIGGRQTCSITIWNDGQVGATYTSQNAFIVEWEGAGPVESFNCILRQDDNTVSSNSCSSPFESGALVDPGNYFVEIQPMGSTCRVQRSTTVGPVVIPNGNS